MVHLEKHLQVLLNTRILIKLAELDKTTLSTEEVVEQVAEPELNLMKSLLERILKDVREKKERETKIIDTYLAKFLNIFYK